MKKTLQLTLIFFVLFVFGVKSQVFLGTLMNDHGKLRYAKFNIRQILIE
jgi:hypothetical protein